MGYVTGIDLGTTYSAAAVFGPDGLTAVDLSNRATVMPSVVAVREDGEVLTGDNAERRMIAQPSSVAREFKRRLGDSVPMLLGGTPYGTDDLTAYLLESIVSVVSEREGGPPELVGLSHPANYGPFKLDLLEGAARTAGVPSPKFVAEPVAAAVHYAQIERVAVDDVIAVYDLGGGTFDASVVRRTGDGFELIGEPDGMDRFGGIDMDEAVLGYVRRVLGDDMDGLDGDDPTVAAALARLREDSRNAKEALSGDSDVEIPVMLPGLHTEVRLTRPEFEDMIRPRVRETISVLERTISSAGLDVSDVSRVLLVGGSSRIPLIGEEVGQALAKPVSLDAHPKLTVALGTARVAHAEIAEPEPEVVPPVITPVSDAGPAGDDSPTILITPGQADPAPTEPQAAQPPPAATEVPTQQVPVQTAPTTPVAATAATTSSGRWKAIAALAAVLLLAGVGAFVVFAGGGDDDEPAATDAPTTTAETESPGAADGVLTVPQLIGQAEVSARNALASDGFSVAVEYVEVAQGSANDGFVMDQSLPAGNQVDEGTPISITVGRSAVVDPTTTPAPTTEVTTTTTTTTTPPPASAEDELNALIDQDANVVGSVLESWVPQLSAKEFGLEYQGILYGYDEILTDHQIRRDPHGAILADGGSYNFDLAGWYITLVPISFPTFDGALDWCRNEGIGRDDCFAKYVSADTSIQDTIELQ